MSKIMHNKIFICLALFMTFTFILNTNISYAKKISFDLHDGLISTLVGGEKNETETEPVDEDQIVKDGAYIISVASNNKYVLDINNSSLDWDGNLQLWSRNGGANQKFYISYQGDGYYKISSVCSALPLDIMNGSKENCTNIRQWDDNGSDAQRFKIIKNSDGTYSFQIKTSGKMLDIDGAVFEDGRNVQQYESNNTSAQRFKLEKTDLVNEGIISIKKATNYKVVLDVPSNSSEDGLAIQLYENNNSLAQRFEVHKVDENEIRIRTVSSGGWLTEKGTKNGSAVIQSGDSKTPASNSNTWIVGWNNGVTLKNKESGLYLDINANSTENGAKIQVWEKMDDQPAQRFLINGEHLIPDGWYVIDSAVGKRLDLDNSGSDWGTNIHLWEANNQNNQKFKITYTDSGYKITTMYGLALDVENGSKSNGANVRQWDDNNSDAQRWLPELIDGGYIKFKNVNSNKYLDVENASTENGANVQQYGEKDTEGQLWRLNTTSFVSGWFSMNGAMYCADPVTGEIVKNCTRVDPTMTDPAQYGAIYDFDNEGRATWHLPTEADLPGGTGPNAPVPTNLQGDRRQRVLLLALSRLGCPYQGGNAPTGFVCDGLTAWSYTTALGDWFYNGPGSREDLQDASWQWDKVKNRNGIKYDQNQLKPGDLVFFGNPQVTQGPGMIDYNGAAYHAGIYYKDGIMINARVDGVGYYSVADYYMSWLGGGSPYEAETSKVEIPH